MRVLDCTTLQLVGSVDTYLPSQSTYDKFCPFNSVSQSCANLFSTIVLYEGGFSCLCILHGTILFPRFLDLFYSLCEFNLFR